MAYTATVTKTGQITIPKAVREILGVKPGQRVVFRQSNAGTTIAHEKTAQEIAEEIDTLIPSEAKKHHMREYAGMTSSEMQEKWLETPDAHKYLEKERKRAI